MGISSIFLIVTAWTTANKNRSEVSRRLFLCSNCGLAVTAFPIQQVVRGTTNLAPNPTGCHLANSIPSRCSSIVEVSWRRLQPFPEVLLANIMVETSYKHSSEHRRPIIIRCPLSVHASHSAANSPRNSSDKEVPASPS